ncbi:MAG: hypothetical protein H6623_00660 [Bdellovibrionaceae bacterium]|nr:hypothetical protein [Pseudobdellovibrionaceae bacterium]
MKLVMVLCLFVSSNIAFAMSVESVGECVMNNSNNLQTVVGLWQSAAMGVYGEDTQSLQKAGSDLVNKLAADSVKTCADAELVYAEEYVALLKQNKAK